MEAVPARGKHKVGFELRSPANISSGTYFERGDVLLSKITPSFENEKQGIGIIPSDFGVGSTELIPLQAIDKESNNYFLFYYLLHPDVRSTLAGKMEGSTGRQRVPETAIQNFPLPNPPRVEQDKIASLLRKVQRAVEIEEAIVGTARELKRATLDQLFTYGLGNEPRKESEVGPIPETWEIRELEEMREFLQYGTSTKCDYHGKGNPVIRIPNIVDGKITTGDLKWCELTDREVSALSLADGDVLFIRTNGVRERVGTCSVYHGQPANALFASYLIRARLKAHVLNADFFQYYSMTPAGVSCLAGRASPAADGKFNINTKNIDSILVPLPPSARRHEQDEIVRILKTIDRKISVHERRRDTWRELFKTLLHELMTGRIRVDGINIDTSEVIG